jgi:hypothetical protein
MTAFGISRDRRPHLFASNTERFLSESEVQGGHIYIAPG